MPQAREALAVSANPSGEACYPALIRSFVTKAVPADEIHAVGLEQVAKIRDRNSESPWTSTLAGVMSPTFCAGSTKIPAFTFESEDAVLKYSTDALDAVKAAMPRAFGTLPKADVLVKPYPEFAESGSGEYHSSSEDGTRPGIFYIAVTDPAGRSKSNQLATLHHETYPGHHLQGARLRSSWVTPSTHWRAIYGTRATARAGPSTRSALADELGLVPHSHSIASASTRTRLPGPHGW